eukprot:c15868_g1_i2.p1 GENE.c15868_g1_i2~~c15868_g1_i2.p1  ORF type:complete len:142 (+),score=21.02 c15868_g1_i2:219-644(+)
MRPIHQLPDVHNKYDESVFSRILLKYMHSGHDLLEYATHVHQINDFSVTLVILNNILANPNLADQTTVHLFAKTIAVTNQMLTFIEEQRKQTTTHTTPTELLLLHAYPPIPKLFTYYFPVQYSLEQVDKRKTKLVRMSTHE